METSQALDRCAEYCVPDRCEFGRGEECAMWHDPRMALHAPHVARETPEHRAMADQMAALVAKVAP